jgi:hypothetical protein
METHFQQTLIKIGKILFVTLWAIWFPFQIATGPVQIEPVKQFYSNVTGVPVDKLSSKPGEFDPLPNAFDEFTRSEFVYSFMPIVLIIVIITGLLFLAKGRDLFEKFLLLQVFAIPLERESWGKVYDYSNSKPIPFAIIRLIRSDDNGADDLVSQTVADLDGRYRLYSKLEDSNYTLEVSAEKYETYRKELSGSLIPYLALVNSIPLKPLDYKQGLSLSYSYNKVQNTITNVLIAFIYIVAFLPGSITIYNLLFHFGFVAIMNGIIWGYAVPWNTYVVLRRLIYRPGKIINSYTLRPLEGVTLDIFKDEKHILSAMTDSSGIPKFDLEPGKYTCKVSKVGYSIQEGFDENGQEITINKDGFIEQNISMIPVLPDTLLSSNLLSNPFS